MRWIPFIIFIIIVQWYAFQAIKTITQNKFWWAIYALVVGIILGGVLWHTLNFDRTVGWTPIVAY